jgi:uncharacterized membrane protein
MYFNTIVILHVLAAAVWVGGLFYATFIQLYGFSQLSDPHEHRPLLKDGIERFRRWSVLAAAVLLITGLMLLPLRTFHTGVRLAALATMILGWVFMTAMTFGTMPEQAFSGRPDDIEEKQQEQWDPDRLFWIYVTMTVAGIIAMAAGTVLAYA